MDLKTRVRKRIPYDEVTDDVLEEYIVTVSDRLCLRLGTEKLPDLFGSICVDAVVKMHRRTYYEGISSESSGNINTSFVDDILNEYSGEIERYRNGQANSAGSGRMVRFI